MSNKILSLILMAGIVLTACNGQTTENAETPTPAPATDTAVPATKTPIEEATVAIPVTGETGTPSPSPTPTVIVPENAADCVNKAAFVSDVTIPDNSKVTAGTAFTKTWRVRNDGTCIWWSGYTLEHYSETSMSAPPSVPLPVTNPGETADISVDLVAPSVAGTYRGNFVIKNPKDLIMQVDNDSRLWLIIEATSAPAGTVTPEGSSVTSAPTGSSSASASGGATCDFTTNAVYTEQVSAAINTYRTQNTLGEYNVNAQLAQAAQAHAQDMACNQLFVHTGSDGSTPQTRVAATGYTASRVTENVYGSYPPLSPTQVVTWWKFDTTDPNHNKNLISTEYTDIGIGYAFYNNYGYYVVVFATP